MVISKLLARRILPLALLPAALVLASPSIADPGRYEVHNLVADLPGKAPNPDAHLVNAWGIAFNPNAVVWVADNGKGVSTLYDGAGTPQKLFVKIPSANGTDDGTPTGITFNGTPDFSVTKNGVAGVAAFLFASEDGVISGWSPAVDMNNAIIAVKTPGGVYKGIAIAGDGTANHVYAANFATGQIDVFTNAFAPTTVTGGFKDPNLPAGFAPFNIMNIQGNLYVAYAMRKPGSIDEQAGPGLGIVDVFDADGFLLRRLATRGKLNAPWGMALAPTGFGRFSNHLIVGNFGDGTLNAYNLVSGNFSGQLRGANGQPLVIDGLWGIAFGNGVKGQPTDTLFFAAGPDDESHGLYGRIDPIPDAGGDQGDDNNDQ